LDRSKSGPTTVSRPPLNGNQRRPALMRRSPEEWHGRALDGPGARLDCKLGTYYHSLSTSECLDAELSEAYAAWPDAAPESAVHSW
jgi:hypothetical protein